MDGVEQKLSWKGGRFPYDLSVEQYGGVCLKLYHTRAKLYSYTFTLPDPDGELARNKANARWLDVISTVPISGVSTPPSQPQGCRRFLGTSPTLPPDGKTSGSGCRSPSATNLAKLGEGASSG